MGAILLLEDGRTFTGDAYVPVPTHVGEAVFNTALSGYKELLSDPSYAYEIVAMTASHIGNTPLQFSRYVGQPRSPGITNTQTRP